MAAVQTTITAPTIIKDETGRVIQYNNPETGYAWRFVKTKPETWLGEQEVKVIESPGVYLVGSMKLHEASVDAFLADHQITTFSPWEKKTVPHEMPKLGGGFFETTKDIIEKNGRGTDSELAIELSGRICYMSYERPRPGGVASFIERLKSEGHGSVFEHPHYSFIVSGVSRNMSLEANRHRPFSISQLSGRFVDASEVGFVRDPDLTDIEVGEWAGNCVTAFNSYTTAYEKNYNRHLGKWLAQANEAKPSKEQERKMIKKARERARDILPGCLETRVLYTVNTRAIRFIFEKRCHADAAFEIRRCFNRLYLALKSHDPHIFSDYTETHLDDGTFSVHTPYGKI